MEQHEFYMRRALELAQAQLGQTWPNPSVGAVIVKDGVIIGEGTTAHGGRPHAETIALEQVGDAAKGATLYVSLEPCSHQGKTPPCVDAIIHAAISHCVIGCGDPNPLVAGKGIAALKAAGIKTTSFIMESEAEQLNRGFFSVIKQNRPYIALKIATSADGKIANAPATKSTITSPQSREHSHTIRASFDAILTGIGTVLADDPLLTVRISGLEHKSPVRVVLDRNHRLPENCQLKQTQHLVPLWCYDLPLEEVITNLCQRGITRLLVEAGQGLNTAFLQNGLVDRIYWYQAPHIIGAKGLDALENTSLSEAFRAWQPVGDVLTIGPDRLVILEKPCSPASFIIQAP